MQHTLMAAPAPPNPTEPEVLAMSLGVDDPTGVIALIAEVDAIFCAADAPRCQRPAPPAVGCALRGPWRAGRSSPRPAPRPHTEPVQRIDPMQRSPPMRKTSAPQRNPKTL
jgi:hypothetical protein